MNPSQTPVAAAGLESNSTGDGSAVPWPVWHARPTPADAKAFARLGVGMARSLLSPDEIATVRDTFQRAGDKGPIAGLADPDMLDPNAAGRDAMLRRFPRMLHPHRHTDRDFGRLAMRWMIDPRIAETLQILLGEPPVAAQSMYYFKGPGARGQALHQDNNALAVRPGTCYAAWIAVDDCDEDNGALALVPGTGDWDIQCDSVTADTADEFWGGGSLALPDGYTPVTARMRAGDALFFNGSLIHGSYRNRSTDRWRRSLIFHYAPRSCEAIADFYNPLLDMDGNPIDRDYTRDGGPCGNNRVLDLNPG